MIVEARVSTITPEIAGLRPGTPSQISPDLSRRTRFLVLPVGPIPIQGSEVAIPRLTPENTKKLILKKEKSLHDQIGSEPYNPRKKRSTHDKTGRLIMFRRGGGGGGRCAQTNHDEFPCPTPTRCKKPNTKLKSTAAETRNNRSAAVATNVNTLRTNRRRALSNEAPKTKAA